MSEIIPLKGAFDGSGNPIGVAEATTDDWIPVVNLPEIPWSLVEPGTTLPDARLSSNVARRDETDLHFAAIGVERADLGGVGYFSRAEGGVASFQMFVNGAMEWGSGTAVRDTFLYRQSAGVLVTDGEFRARANSTQQRIAIGESDTRSLLLSRDSHEWFPQVTGGGALRWLRTGSVEVWRWQDDRLLIGTTANGETTAGGIRATGISQFFDAIRILGNSPFIDMEERTGSPGSPSDRARIYVHTDGTTQTLRIQFGNGQVRVIATA